MSTEENKAIFRRLMEEVFTQGNLDEIDELISPDWVNIDPSLPEELHGRDGARQLITMWRAGFSDFELTIDDMIAEGDKVAARFTFSGTHSGEFVGIPATGKHVRGTGTGIFQFADGLDVEHWVNFDALGIMQQLGALPTPEHATA